MRTTLAPLLAAVAACGDDGGTTCGDGYRVCGGQLRDPEGRAMILRGVNLAGAHKVATPTRSTSATTRSSTHGASARSAF